MTGRGRVLENHSLLVRDGRILDILPSAAASERYASVVTLQRPSHLLMPGMVNTHTRAATSLFRAVGAAECVTPGEQRLLGAAFVRDGSLAAIAEMLRSGITCFCNRYYFPEETARAAAEQGMRAVIGMPVDEHTTCGLNLRDEYRGHPLISTVFAPDGPNGMSDQALARIATLADELDAGIVIDLHESAAAIEESVARFGLRPIERLWKLGLLTPALNAVHMTHAGPADIEMARRTGISISLCPESSLELASGIAGAASMLASGMRVGLGSGGGARQNHDIWGAMKLLALMTAHAARDGAANAGAWDVLAAATCGGARALAQDSDVGTLEANKWADLCCADLGGPATQPLRDPVRQLVFLGSRDMVSDVWVAGRQLVSEGEMTRLDWPAVAARADAWAARLQVGR